MKYKNERKKLIIMISIITFLIAILSITNGSMWGDEICRVVDPISGNIINTIKTGFKFAQPGYLLYMYIWERLTFSSSIEFVIRCSNLLFVPIAIFYTYKIVKAKKWSIWTILLFFIHPMFVYYMDEATPYIIVYALSLAYTYYVFFSKDFNSKENIIKINLIYLIGVFIHFMFGFIIIPYIVKCLLENSKEKENIHKHIKILCLFSLIYVPLLISYLICLMHTNTGFGWKNIAFVLYGFLGMAGIGLSRNDLRALNFGNITIIQVILLALMTIVGICLIYFGIKKFKNIIKDEKIYLICLLTYLVVIFGVSYVIKFGVWERHCYTIFPLFMIIFIDIINIILKNRKSFILLVLYIFLIVISSLNIRFNYYYQCDDHKGVYNYIKEHNVDYKYILSNINEDLYNIKKLIGNRKFIDINLMKDKDIIDEFNVSDKVLLILFEKRSNKDLYNYFDDNDNYIVNDTFNSYKIISLRN